MNRIIIYLCLLPCLLNGQTLYVSEAIPASTDGTGMRAPRIALIENDRPVVYWGKTGGTPKLYMALWENNTFGDPVSINTNGIEPDLWGSGLGPQIAAQGNTIFVVFEAYGDGIFCVKSEDGGLSYGLPVSVWDAPPGRVGTLPTVSIDPAGNPVISFVSTNFSEEEAQYEITKSTDGGISFPPTTLANAVTPGDEVCECCPASIVAPTEEEAYLAFRNNNGNLRDIWIAQSTDGNMSYTTATDIDDTDWTTFSCPLSGPRLMAADEQIYSAYFSAATEANIYFSTLTRSTMEVGEQYQLLPHYGQNNVQSHPSLAGSADTVGVIWQEIGDEGYDIVMAWSVDGVLDLNQNTTLIAGGNTSQRYADIAYHDGLFHIVYEDDNEGRVMYRTAGFQEIVHTSNPSNLNFLMQITPNPATDIAVLSFDNLSLEVVNIKLLDSNGRLVQKHSTFKNTFELNCKQLATGTYFIQVQQANNLVTKTLLVE